MYYESLFIMNLVIRNSCGKSDTFIYIDGQNKVFLREKTKNV